MKFDTSSPVISAKLATPATIKAQRGTPDMACLTGGHTIQTFIGNGMGIGDGDGSGTGSGTSDGPGMGNGGVGMGGSHSGEGDGVGVSMFKCVCVMVPFFLQARPLSVCWRTAGHLSGLIT